MTCRTCEHDRGWHDLDGCRFPGCDCRRAIRPPRRTRRSDATSPAARRAEADARRQMNRKAGG